MTMNIGGGGDVGNGDGGGDKVVTFPTTAEERRALRKAKQDRERQRLVNVFIDEAGGDQALFRTPDNIAYADVIIAGHRETWPVRSVQFRHAYVRYLRQQLDRFLDTDPAKALMAKAAMSKAATSTLIWPMPIGMRSGSRPPAGAWSRPRRCASCAPPAPWHYRCQPVA